MPITHSPRRPTAARRWRRGRPHADVDRPRRVTQPGRPQTDRTAAARWRRRCADDEGLSTAELLGNAALAIGALVVIWIALQALGEDVIGYIGGQILGG